jgi:hypothetical protein
MNLLFLIISIVEIIIELGLLIKVKKNGLKKDWHNFLGINIAVLISDIIIYQLLANAAIGLGSAIGALFVCGFTLIINILLLLIGFLMKRKIKKDKKNYFLTGILVFIFNIVIMVSVPLLVSKITINNGKNYVTDYLNKKYGNANYEVVNVYKNYENYGMWDKYLSSYYYEIKSDYMDETFIVQIDESLEYITSDFFLPVYYSLKFNLKYNLEYDDWSSDINYNFDEFNEYVKNNSENKNIEVEYLYKDFVDSWNNIDGVKYNENYLNENFGEIPEFNELIKKLD